MKSMFQVQAAGSQSLPVSQSETQLEQNKSGLFRRRLSSLSLNLKIQQSSSGWASFRRSKSVSSAESSIRNWWDWGWAWILSRKPTFARDLEMNEEETAALGCQSKGSWRHVFYKVTSLLRRKLVGADNVGLPQTFRYDSFSYSKNFDR